MFSGNVRVVPFSQTPQDTSPQDHCHLVHRHTTSLCCKHSLSTILYPPISLLILCFFESQRFPCFAFSHLPIYHQWISGNPPCASSFDSYAWNKVQNCHCLEHFLNLLRFCFPAMVSLAQINWKKFLQVWTFLTLILCNEAYTHTHTHTHTHTKFRELLGWWTLGD